MKMLPLLLLTLVALGNAFAAPVIDLSRTAVSAGRIKTHFSTSVQPVFVTNTGDATLTLQAFQLGGLNPADFTLSGTCTVGLALAPGDRCHIDIVMTPLSATPPTRSATLTIVSDAPVPAPPVELLGAASPDARLVGPTPPYFDFDAQAVGTASASQTVTIGNTNAFELTVTDVQLIGDNAADFSWSTNCPAQSSLAGFACTATVTFTPTGSGPRSALLRYSVVAFGIAGVVEISITGVGIDKAAVANYQGLWWASPPGSESGWGINFAHQGAVIFATWFTYGQDGKPTWFAATLNQTVEGVYAGEVIRVKGVPFDSVPWDLSKIVETPVGTMTVTFADAVHATMAYTVDGVSRVKAIEPQIFAAPVPVCTWGAQSDLALATNFQDLWWAAPPGSESGWGVNFTQQGDLIFLTWFTYGQDGEPTWFIAVAQKSTEATFVGPISTVTGNPFDAEPWDVTKQLETEVGSIAITFTDGNHATFAYTVGEVSQSKAITRQVFQSPGTTCR